MRWRREFRDGELKAGDFPRVRSIARDAAMKIYDASDPTFKINPCRFFDNNEHALENMKELAERS